MYNTTDEEQGFIYRGYLWKILYFFHNKSITSESYSQIKEYYDVWEEELSLNLVIHVLLKQEKIPFLLWKLLLDILEKYPPDWVYVQVDTANELIKKLKKSEIILESE